MEGVSLCMTALSIDTCPDRLAQPSLSGIQDQYYSSLSQPGGVRGGSVSGVARGCRWSNGHGSRGPFNDHDIQLASASSVVVDITHGGDGS